MGSNLEEQEQELEALESIYPSELSGEWETLKISY